MTDFTARIISNNSINHPHKLAATKLAAAKKEAAELLGDGFLGDTISIEYEGTYGSVPAATMIIGHKNWINELGADYVD